MRRRGSKPKNPFRRVERWFVGLAMGVLAFAIEKAVLRSIRKGGAKQASSEPREPFATSKGTDVTGG